MASWFPMRGAALAALAAGCVAITTPVLSAESQGQQSTSKTPEPVKIGNLEFRIRSATIARGASDNNDVVRLTFAVRNNAETPISLYLVSWETAIALDTGYTISGSSGLMFSAAGAIFCPKSARERCKEEEANDLTPFLQNSTTNIILTFPFNFTADVKKSIERTETIDFATVIYVSSFSDSGFVPLTIADVPVRNMLR